MMTKEEHIKHWLKSADEDMKDIIVLFNNERYVKALYVGHLYLEKVCKALWVKNNIENIAPYTHNLNRLLEGIETGLSNDDIDFLNEINKYHIEARYSEYIDNLNEETTAELAGGYINRIKTIDQCLRKKL
jgi:HEPN domain-containing protein